MYFDMFRFSEAMQEDNQEKDTCDSVLFPGLYLNPTPGRLPPMVAFFEWDFLWDFILMC